MFKLAYNLLQSFIGPTVVRVGKPQFVEEEVDGKMERRVRSKTTLHAQHGAREKARRLRQMEKR